MDSPDLSLKREPLEVVLIIKPSVLYDFLLGDGDSFQSSGEHEVLPYCL